MTHTRNLFSTLQLLSCILVLCSGVIMADDSQPIEEVFQAEVVYPQEQGEVQVTTAPRFSRGEFQDVGMVPLSLEYGLTNAWQFNVEWNSFVTVDAKFAKAQRGIGDLELGTKYSLMNLGSSGLHAAIAAEIGFPVGDETKGLGSGETSYGGSVILAKDLKQSGAQLFTQLGAEASTDEAESFWHAGFFLSTSFLTLTGEYSWTKEASYLTPGMVLMSPGSLQLGIGIPIGLTEDSDDYQIIGLVTYEFCLGHEQEDAAD